MIPSDFLPRPDLALAGRQFPRHHGACAGQGIPCCYGTPLPACPRQYPGGAEGTALWYCSFHHRLRPSPIKRRVGLHIRVFEACSAFNRIGPADSLSHLCDLYRSASVASLPPLTAPIATGWSNSYRAGFSLLKFRAFSRHTLNFFSISSHNSLKLS